MNSTKPRCLKCTLILKPGHICKPKCDSCHEFKHPNALKEYPDANGQYCKECYKQHLQCSVCKRIFISGWALTGHPSHGYQRTPWKIVKEHQKK